MPEALLLGIAAGRFATPVLAGGAAAAARPLVADPDLAAAYDRLYREGYLPPLAAR